MTDQDKIRLLAEAMGREHCPDPNCNDRGFSAIARSVIRWDASPYNPDEPIAVEDVEWEQQQCEFCYTHPNSIFSFTPLTDANDDYAVLEWFREWAKERPAWMYAAFVESVYKLGGESFIGYRVGNYARAAIPLIVEDRSKSNEQ